MKIVYGALFTAIACCILVGCPELARAPAAPAAPSGVTANATSSSSIEIAWTDN